jgi:hypothetical protein
MAKKRSEAAEYTYNEIEIMSYGHNALDGTYDEIVGGGGDDKKAIKQHYKLGVTRLLLAENATLLARAMEDFVKARNALIMEIAGDGKKSIEATDKEGIAKFQEQEEALRERKVSIALNRIDVTKLDLDHNPIPITVIRAIAPILDNFV